MPGATTAKRRLRRRQHAQQRIVWTVLPYGRVEDGAFAGRLRVSIVVSPRLTPLAASEQTLGAFPEWLNWPETLSHVTLGLRIGAAPAMNLERIGQADPSLWTRLFGTATPVAGFVFKNMALVNLRSFAVRNVLGLVRKHYGALAVQWRAAPDAAPSEERASRIERDADRAGRAHPDDQSRRSADRSFRCPASTASSMQDNPEGLERRLGDLVFGPRSRLQAAAASIAVDAQGNPVSGPTFALRALPPDWIDPTGGGPSAPVMSQFSTAAEGPRCIRRIAFTAVNR